MHCEILLMKFGLIRECYTVQHDWNSAIASLPYFSADVKKLKAFCLKHTLTMFYRPLVWKIVLSEFACLFQSYRVTSGRMIFVPLETRSGCKAQ